MHGTDIIGASRYVARALAALPIDDRGASSYALLATKIVAAGRQPRARAFDLLIAATAHAHCAVPVTRSLGDFAGVDDVLEVRAP